MLIQVVAQLRPELCGVTDHALLLAQELEASFGISSAFVVLNSNERCDLPYPVIYSSPSGLLEACDDLGKGRQAAILVHYSGYGYSTDGAPLMLADAVGRVSDCKRFRIGIYFHELFATGMPWTSAFWYSGRQQRVARRLTKDCDLIATNLEHHARWLAMQAGPDGASSLQTLPVFSNIGESSALTAVNERRRSLCVFGLAGTRRKSYERLLRLGDMLNDLGVEEIVDIGPGDEGPSSVGKLQVKRMGVLPAAELAGLLAKSMFGFVPHPAFCLAKSGIFAGLCAHGTIPVLPKSFSGEVDGLNDGVQVLSPRTAQSALDAGLERCSAAAWHWYSKHALRVHAATYSRLLFDIPTEAEIERSVASQVAEVQVGYVSR
jgi:hypothetical protein